MLDSLIYSHGLKNFGYRLDLFYLYGLSVFKSYIQEINMSKQVLELIAQQDNTFSIIKKSQINFKKTGKDRLTRGYIITKKETLEDHWNDFVQKNRELAGISNKEERASLAYFTGDKYSSCEDIYTELKATMTDMLEGPTQTLHNSFSQEHDDIKLPKINIPQFTGNYQDWTSFHDLFVSLIHNKEKVAKVNKLHYLKSYLTGEPEQLLKHLSVTEENYDIAWSTLKNRYNNKRIIVNSILNRLMNQKKMHNPTAKSIRELLDTTVECLNQLKTQNVDCSSWDALIIYIIVTKMDTDSHKEWEEEISTLNIQELPKFSKLQSFLEKRFRVLEMMQSSTATNKHNPNQASHSNILKSKTFHVAQENKESKCIFCKQNHYLYQCKEFQQLRDAKKTEFVKNNRVCFNCLIQGHPVRFCKHKSSCHKCGKRHHSLLHRGNTSYTPRANQFIEKEETEGKESETESKEKEIINHLTTGHVMALLSTALINVKNDQGSEYTLRALLDPCSQESFISESIAQTMGLRRTPVKGHVSGLGTMRTPIRYSADLVISSRIKPEKTLKITTYLIKKVTSIMPSEKLHIENWSHLRDLQLADPTYYKPGHIDILLGVDVYNEMILTGLRKGNPGSPIALQTHLGWIISGKVNVDEEKQDKPFVSMHLNMELNTMLRKFWELETMEEEKETMTADERRTEEIYERTTKRENDGRYIVELPFRTDPPVLPSNSREIAIKRWKSLENRLEKSPKLKRDYNQVIEEYLALNHLERIDRESETRTENCVYLPHHAVIREDKETSRTRVVFDASCKGNNGVSLNDALLIGPQLIEELRAIMLRWRKHKIAFIADIEKMYRQIRIERNQTDYQRIVWRSDPTEPLGEYRLLTVTFGTSCAPYLAVKTLRRTAMDEGSNFPEAKRIILHDFYMDDLLSGKDNIEEAIEVQRQITTILKLGGFKLQKWCSNSTEFMKELQDKEIFEESNRTEIQIKEKIKTLGVTWEVQGDKLTILNQLKDIEETNITKRKVLAEIASLFDPMGWIAPAIVIAKILMQKMWREGIDWDEELSEKLQVEWLQFKRELPELKKVKLNRWIHTTQESYLELHGFADASALAYAAVVYARVVNERGEVEVSLLSAKTKVSPIKLVSLPRLELCAARLLSKHLKQIAKTLNVHARNMYAWSDSQVVLAWIRGDPMRWKPFVKNRVVEIIETIEPSRWFYVNTKHNPADPASRGVMPLKLLAMELWWNGPEMLKRKEIELVRGNTTDTALERKKSVVTALILNNTVSEEKLTLLQRYSTIDKLVRVVAYCRRWLRALDKNKRKYLPYTYLTFEERSAALTSCIKMAQELEFFEEIDALQNSRRLKNKSRLLTLSPFLDEKGVVRVGGRLKHSDMEFMRRHPIIISRKSLLVPLLLREAHIRTLHGGPQMMITYLRGKYWLINAKNAVKRYVRECVICARQRAENKVQKMGDLPEIRVTPARPFSISGVDFAGPINVRMSKGRGAKSTKAYISLFICMCTKALHLEVVSDMTTQAFLAAVRRFVARRGHVKEMWSDHGTTFHGAEKELISMWKQGQSNIPNELASTLDREGTKWKYIPPGAPNFGGLWEAGVKSTKYHLKRIVGDSTLTFEELSTVLTQIEACLNSRPLSEMSDHPTDLEPLTPGHLLIGEPLVVIPSPDVTEVKMNVLDRWQLTTRMVQNFWKRWQSEYLSRMQERFKWKNETSEFNVGDLVIIKDQRFPPGRWPMGRILKKYPGPDNLTRTYDVKTSSGVMRRAISKLCPLLSSYERYA